MFLLNWFVDKDHSIARGKNRDETQELGYPRINSSHDDKDCDCDDDHDDDDDDDDAAADGVGGGGEEEQCAISPPEKRLRTAVLLHHKPCASVVLGFHSWNRENDLLCLEQVEKEQKPRAQGRFMALSSRFP
eukprot:symbB.v1.2.005622.t1/scaffold309.1/size276354/3